MSQRGPGPIPNRWLFCPRKADSIIADRFLAFKTPLSSDFDDQMQLEYVFPPSMIFDYCKTLKHKLGLWIDLTNTKRFYDRSVVEQRGAQYIKLQCRGHGETPSVEQTRAFIEIVDNFIADHPIELIAVHCTHGFNRTGFLIVSYLVERMDFSVEAALSIFSKVRTPGIYKQDYINELFNRYEPYEDPISAPDMPDWGLDYDDSQGDNYESSNSHKRRYNRDNESSTSKQAAAAAANDAGNDHDEFEGPNDRLDGTNVNGNGDEQPSRKRRREMIIKDATFMQGVPGVTQVTEQPLLGQLQLKVQEWCGWKKSGFPGSQPVSMDRDNIKRLNEIPYRVSWKADGTRYMMLIMKRDEIYFFDRNHSCFQVDNLTFAKANQLHDHLEDTLVDGEMVLDKHQGNVTPRYLIYDIIRVSNQDVREKPFYPVRLNLIKTHIIDPRYAAIGRGIINRQLEPIGVRNKEFWDIRKSASLLGEKFAKRLSHEPDGLIFQPSLQPYTAGVCVDVFKWKPSDMNSIDFKLKIIVESGEGILPRKIGLLYVGGHDAPFDRLTKVTKAVRELDNKIIECTVNPQGGWEIMRERTDKKLPNSYSTAKSVLESIKHPVTKEYLLDYINTFGFRDEQEKMPPPLSAPNNHNHHNNHQHHHHQEQHYQIHPHHHHHQQQQHMYQRHQQHQQQQ